MQDQIQIFADKNKISRTELKSQIWKKFQQMLTDNDTSNMDVLLSLGLIDAETFGEKLVEMFANLCSIPNCPKKNVPEESRVHVPIMEESRNPSQAFHIGQAVLLVKYMNRRNIALSYKHTNYIKKRQRVFLNHGCLDFFKHSLTMVTPSNDDIQKVYKSYFRKNWDDGIRLVHSMTGIEPDEVAIEDLSSADDEMNSSSLSLKIKNRLQDTFRNSTNTVINPEQQMNVVCTEVVKFLYA
ncbi:MAG: hypothetical protein HQL69_02720 [Magnetococcales bacterium]|nr:hypothetical protein [Magnetococcales bacterium]